MSEHRAGDVSTTWGAEGGAWAILVHGGAGRRSLDDEGASVAGCRAAVEAAASVLRAGGSALDAVERAVSVLEADPVFNAGTGACLNAEGGIELDAALMDGAMLRAGAVCALPPFLHPVAIARAALEDGRHVLYAAEGAARFARDKGFTPTTSDAMTTEATRAEWSAWRQGSSPASHGTVGAVARDAQGHVAAATSTGGVVGKRPGRVGDSPLLGAGTYADDEAGACSATGLGESIMRVGLARCACECMASGAMPERAANAALRRLAERVGGPAGIILVDPRGRLGLARNTAAMPWAAAGAALSMTAGS